MKERVKREWEEGEEKREDGGIERERKKTGRESHDSISDEREKGKSRRRELENIRVIERREEKR